MMKIRSTRKGTTDQKELQDQIRKTIDIIYDMILEIIKQKVIKRIQKTKKV